VRIKFLKNASYPQSDPTKSREYKADEEYDVADDHGQRWIRRNLAIEVPKPKAKVVEEAPKEAPKAVTTASTFVPNKGK
jgi:hypothetical protein